MPIFSPYDRYSSAEIAIIMAQPKIKVPFVIDEKMVIRSRQNDTLKVSCRVLGAWHGKYLIVEDPVFHINERLFSRIEGEVFCWYLCAGNVYHFRSKILGSHTEGFTLLEYPDDVQIDKLREHPRIPMQLATEVRLENTRGNLRSTMNDISAGGCSLTIHSLEVIAQNMSCGLSFMLPDGQAISGLKATVRSSRTHSLRKITEVGLKFVGPRDSIEAISSFCQSFAFLKSL